MFVKAGWGLAGGVLLLLTIFGQRIFPVGGDQRRRASAFSMARAVSAPASDRLRCGGFSDRSRPRSAAPSVPRTSSSAASTSRSPVRRRCRWRRCVCCARISADRFSGCSARCCCRWRCPIAFRGRVFAAELALVTLTLVGVELPDRLRSSTAPAGRRERCRSRSARCSGAGLFWLLILSRWQASQEHAVALEDEAPPSHSARGAARSPRPSLAIARLGPPRLSPPEARSSLAGRGGQAGARSGPRRPRTACEPFPRRRG